MLKGSKASEHGSEYDDDEESNKDAASKDGDDDKNNKDAASEDGEPKGVFVSLPENLPPNKQMEEPQEYDPTNTKSGCTMPAQEDMDRHMDEGRENLYDSVLSQSNLNRNSNTAKTLGVKGNQLIKTALSIA